MVPREMRKKYLREFNHARDNAISALGKVIFSLRN
jgi:hypothetical protein